MFEKGVTQRIVELWGLGYTAEETVNQLKEKYNIKISLHTVYNKRNSLTAKEMISELQREQLKEIASAKSPGLRLKYRNELLKILLPVRMEQKMKLEGNNMVVEIVDNSKQTKGTV
jgi:Fe2+ or Zn2+ uptake regulation protein